MIKATQPASIRPRLSFGLGGRGAAVFQRVEVSA